MRVKSSTQKIYFDEDVDARLADSLLLIGYDVVKTVDAGLLGPSDEEQLTYATSQQRTLVTHNIKHFPSLHSNWILENKKHWGIIVLIGHSAIGVWMRRVRSLLIRYSSHGLRNHLFFLGVEFDHDR